MTRRPLGAVAAAAVVLAAACGSGSAGTAGDTSAPTTGHAGAHTSSPVAAAQPLRAGERFLDLAVSKPYTPSPPHGGTDEYRCLVVDPHLTTPAFLTGTQFVPQNPPIVHHAIVFAVAPGRPRRPARATPPPGRRLDLLRRHRASAERAATPAGSAAGPRARTRPPRSRTSAIRLEPGSLLVLQVHYNLLASDGRPGETDQSAVRLRLTDGTAAHPLRTRCVGGADRAALRRRRVRPAVRPGRGRRGRHPALRPRGRLATEAQLVCDAAAARPVPGNTQHCDHRGAAAQDRVRRVGHMHLLGRSIKVRAQPRHAAGARTLLDVPSYDFDDQALRPLADARRRQAGRHPAGHLHPRRRPASATAAAQTSSRRVTWSGATAPATRCASAS